MARVEGVNQLLAVLKRKGADMKDLPSIVVGFGTNYGIHVHENLEAFHPVGQAKFLEEPARTKGKEIGRDIAEAYRRGANLETAMIVGGLRLQREAQLLTPVDTGALKGSAFTELE